MAGKDVSISYADGTGSFLVLLAMAEQQGEKPWRCALADGTMRRSCRRSTQPSASPTKKPLQGV